MGRLFSNSLYSAGVMDDIVHALEELGLDYEELRHEEYDMGLGNGGLGRLASCFLDSLATLDLPAIGYGIHYQYGLFKQEFRNGYQVELPDAWMQYGTPWEIVRPEQATEIQVYGYVENVFDDRGNYVPRWMGWKKLVGIPYDIPVPGYGTEYRQLPAPLGIASARRVRFRSLQPRRIRGSRARKKPQRNHLEGSLPE